MFHIFIYLLIVILSYLKITRLHCWLTWWISNTNKSVSSPITMTSDDKAQSTARKLLHVFMEDSHLKDLTFFAGENLPPKWLREIHRCTWKVYLLHLIQQNSIVYVCIISVKSGCVHPLNTIFICTHVPIRQWSQILQLQRKWNNLIHDIHRIRLNIEDHASYTHNVWCHNFVCDYGKYIGAGEKFTSYIWFSKIP
jgi:hypothetical protein